MLLKVGADVDARCQHTGESVLETLLANNTPSPAIEKLAITLIARGAKHTSTRDLKASGGCEGRALDLAARRGYARVFKALIEQGASPKPCVLENTCGDVDGVMNQVNK